MKETPQIGDLRVWWIPQVPGKAFEVDVGSVPEGVLIMDTLAHYDTFQFEHKIKPDYSNAGGLQMWSATGGDNGEPGWEDWYDEETGIDSPHEWVEAMKEP